jgi:hypothetical protein
VLPAPLIPPEVGAPFAIALPDAVRAEPGAPAAPPLVPVPVPTLLLAPVA